MLGEEDDMRAYVHVSEWSKTYDGMPIYSHIKFLWIMFCIILLMFVLEIMNQLGPFLSPNHVPANTSDQWLSHPFCCAIIVVFSVANNNLLLYLSKGHLLLCWRISTCDHWLLHHAFMEFFNQNSSNTTFNESVASS